MVALVAVACNETPVDIPGAASIVLSTNAITLAIGESESVDAQVIDGAGEVVSNADLVWSSDNSRVVQVSGSGGSLEGVGAGTANVTVTHGSLTGTIVVTVVGASSLEIFPPVVELVATGSSQELTVRAFGPNGEELAVGYSTTTAGNVVRWHSLDQSIARVGAEGATEFVYAVNVGGTFVVASAMGAADTIPVVVVADDRGLVTVIDILSDTVSMDVATADWPGEATVMITALDGDGDERCDATVSPIHIRYDDAVVADADVTSDCTLEIEPGMEGGSWLYLENTRASDSIWVEVSDLQIEQHSGWNEEDDQDVEVGGVGTYSITLQDRDGNAVPGVRINFNVQYGSLAVPAAAAGIAAAGGAQITTDENGQAAVEWTYPTEASPNGSEHEITFTAELPGGGFFDEEDLDVEVHPGPAATILFMADFVWPTDDNPDEVDGEIELPDGTSITMPLGETATVWVQSYDSYGNQRNTDVIFSPSDPTLIEDEYDDGYMEYTYAVPEDIGEYTLGAEEGAASATLTIEVVAPGAKAVMQYGAANTTSNFFAYQRMYVGWPQLSTSVGSAASDVNVYDGLSGRAVFPNFTQDDEKVGFLWEQTGYGGMWNVALVDADGDDAAAPVGILDDDHRSNEPWGYPVWVAQTGTEGKLVFLSDRDTDKIAAVEQMWDLYIWDPDAGTAEKLTATAADDNRVYRGLSLSADEDKVLVVMRYHTDAGGDPVYSQVIEVALSDGQATTLTSNTSADVNYAYATYSPDNSLIYVDAENQSGGETNLYEFNPTTGAFRLLRDDNASNNWIPDWGWTSWYGVTFDPDDPNVMTYTQGNGNLYNFFVDMDDPQNYFTTGRYYVKTMSWSRR
jgi:hypothetical protein